MPSLKYGLGHYLFVLPQLQIVNLCPISFGILIQNIVHFKTCKLFFLPAVLPIWTFYSAVSKGNSLGKLTVWDSVKAHFRPMEFFSGHESNIIKWEQKKTTSLCLKTDCPCEAAQNPSWHALYSSTILDPRGAGYGKSERKPRTWFKLDLLAEEDIRNATFDYNDLAHYSLMGLYDVACSVMIRQAESKGIFSKQVLHACPSCWKHPWHISIFFFS